MSLLSASARCGPNFRNRDCSPALGRLLEQDPLGFDGGDTNLYRYVRNDPIDAMDPMGLKITVGGKPVDQNAAVYQAWLENPLYKEILEKLGASRFTIDFKSMDDLGLELKVREAYINCMKKICRITESPPGTVGCRFGSPCTEAQGWNGGEYKGPSPSDALDRLMANSGTRFE